MHDLKPFILQIICYYYFTHWHIKCLPNSVPVPTKLNQTRFMSTKSTLLSSSNKTTHHVLAYTSALNLNSVKQISKAIKLDNIELL